MTESTLQEGARSTVIFGVVGTVLDGGKGDKRWGKWRPTVSLGRLDGLAAERIELLCEARFLALGHQLVRDLREVAPGADVALHPMTLEDPWDFEEVWRGLYDFAASYPFDDEREDYLLHITTGTHVMQICMFLLAESRHIPARLLQTAPVRRDKGESSREHAPPGRPSRHTVIDLDLSRYDSIAQRYEAERRDDVSVLKLGIATRNPSFNALMDRIQRVALASDAPILLTGPTGAGKTRLAKRIHAVRHAHRMVSGAYVEVNCATLRGDAAASALFGHKRGAFTGAVADRAGLLRAADGGLIFLDEIGELGLDEQAMLLRAIEEKVFVPMGSDREVTSDFQLIAGTNRDLVEAVAEGSFRDDLLARINLWSFRLPGLAERIEDLEPNLDYELTEAARRLGRKVALSADARRRYLEFASSPEGRWTGNFRDLNASVTRMATLARGGRITNEDVDVELARLRHDWRGAASRRGDDRDLVEEVLGREGAENLDRFDLVQLAEVIRACREARTLSEAGRALFAVSRKARSTPNDADRLRKYLLRHGLRFEDLDGSRPG